jgi:hypothetical protein
MEIGISWSSEHSCKRLEICKGYAITDRAIVIPGARLRKSVLRVNDFENGGLAVFVAEGREAKAVGSEFGGSF